MKIGLVVIATNKYNQFINQLIESADKYFLEGKNVTYFIFTDQDLNIESNRDLVKIFVEHREWPWMTLGRYKIFSDNKDSLSKMDYIYYCDVDMIFVDYVCDEIISDRVVTQHPGFIGERGTPEVRPESLAYVSPNEEMQYFAGGFNGGSSLEFLKMSEVLAKNIEEDYRNGIIAIWHDESHMNRYLIDNKPTKILSPSYCYVESMNLPFQKKLVALEKNHNNLRY